MIHNEASEFKNKNVKIKKDSTHPQVENFGGSDFIVEDYWDRVAGKSWMFCDGNPTCLIYAIRSAFNNLPTDNEVLYGKIGSFGHLIHISEIDEIK